MALVSGTATRYDLTGLRESLHDRIYDISPMDTPFIAGAGRGPNAKQTLEEWQTDSLSSAAANAQLEGDDASFSLPGETTRVGNYTQIMRKTLILSDTAEVVDKAGRKSELAYQLTKRGQEIKRDLEFICLRAQAGVGGSSSVARTMAGLNAWLKTNTNHYTTTGDDPVYTSGVPGVVRTDGGTLRALTETIGKDVIQQGWTEGANFSTLMVGPFNKQRISEDWSGIATRNYDLSNVPAKPMASIASIDVYVSDFGVLRVVPNRFQRERDAWFLDFEYVELRYLRPLRQVKLAKSGDAEKRMMVQEVTLKVSQEAALGAAFDLETA